MVDIDAEYLAIEATLPSWEADLTEVIKTLPTRWRQAVRVLQKAVRRCVLATRLDSMSACFIDDHIRERAASLRSELTRFGHISISSRAVARTTVAKYDDRALLELFNRTPDFQFLRKPAFCYEVLNRIEPKSVKPGHV